MKRIPLLLFVLLISGMPGFSQLTPTESQVESMRQYADSLGFYLGTAARTYAINQDADYSRVLVREFNTLSPENELKFKFLSPTQGTYDFSAADRMVAFAEANNMLVRGLPLIWHEGDPFWLRNANLPPDTLHQIFADHITRVVTRYGNRIPVWGVVNEAFLNNGSLRDTIWRQALGDSYIEEAFRLAHAANPDALLFLEDYTNELLNPKSDAMYALLADMVARGVPVHGVGFHMHMRLSRLPDYASMSENIRRFGELGLQVHITELDVRVQDVSGTEAEKQVWQAEMYRDITNVCLSHSNCTALITWGFTDRYTWIPDFTGNPDTPLMFDAQYNPKPAYFAMLETLASYAGAMPPIPDGPALVINPQVADDDPTRLNVHFDLHQASDLYGLEVHCDADPSALAGQGYQAGDGFPEDGSLFINTGFNAADGRWSLAVSLMHPAPALGGDIRAFSLQYTILAAGNHGVDCSVLAVDPNGYTLQLPVINGSEHYNPQQMIAADTPLSQPAENPPVVQESSITGVVTYQRGNDHSGIVAHLIQGDTIVAQAQTDASGRYVFAGVPAGRYRLLFAAPSHLGLAHEIVMDGQPLDMGTSQLLAGDIDSNAVIDVLDAALIGANFLLSVPPGPTSADLTGDGLIDVRDLVLVGLNVGNSGPQ